MYQPGDTICAVATPPGIGGVGILRLSGPRALPAAGAFLSSPGPLEKKRALLFRRLVDPRTDEVLDEGLVLVMPGPESYTGEDVVEFQLHGSPSLLSHLMELLVREGLRPAEPGEFTYRAFQAGRLDLTQAEAVEALVSAQGEAARRQALRHLTGGLAAHLEPLEEALKALYLKVEARLEFSEEGIPPLDLEKFKSGTERVKAALEELLESYRQGKLLRDGLAIALVGPPNVGKSSLLNRLLGAERAIVTPEPGTTRDVIEGQVLMKGVPLRFFDTAGLRESGDLIEAEGIRRSRLVLEEADFIFWLVDASNPKDSLAELRRQSPDPARLWVLFNKEDLVRTLKVEEALGGLDPQGVLHLSCLDPKGLEGLWKALEALVESPHRPEQVLLTSARHQGEAVLARESLDRLLGLVEAGQPYELWAEELKAAALAVGRIRGRNLPAAAFEEIFTRFCIGK